MTFIINQNGVVYQKDLGDKTADLAETMTEYNPDKILEESYRLMPSDHQSSKARIMRKAKKTKHSRHFTYMIAKITLALRLALHSHLQTLLTPPVDSGEPCGRSRFVAIGFVPWQITIAH
jgi:hypothetical protein